MLHAIKEDLFRYYGKDYSKLSVRISYFLKPHTHYFWLFRHEQCAKSGLRKLYWRFRLSAAKYRSGVQIPAGTRIGRGFRMLHFGNVVVHPEAIIGNNCNIAEGVLIGDSFGKDKSGVPQIGDNCCLFANSIVIGGVKLGNDVLVAPGAFVNFDVPNNSIVIGNPGKIIPRVSSPTEKYIVYPIERMK